MVRGFGGGGSIQQGWLPLRLKATSWLVGEARLAQNCHAAPRCSPVTLGRPLSPTKAAQVANEVSLPPHGSLPSSGEGGAARARVAAPVRAPRAE